MSLTLASTSWAPGSYLVARALSRTSAGLSAFRGMLVEFRRALGRNTRETKVCSIWIKGGRVGGASLLCTLKASHFSRLLGLS